MSDRSDQQHPVATSATALAALDGLKNGLDHARDIVASLDTEVESLRRQRDEALANLVILEAHNAELSAQCETAKAQHEQARAEKQRADEQVEHFKNKIVVAQEHNKALEDHIRDLHFDLNAQDLPTLALKMAMQITGAEVGLFTEADGDGTLARIGLDELQEFLVGAIFDFSRKAAQIEQPIVENEPSKLPDGAGLVNLAALPFAVKGELRGVLLLANKRSGPFTDAECRLLLAIGQHAGLAMDNARLHQQLGDSYASTVAVLADAIEAKDAYTRGHCEGVSRIAVEVAHRLGLGQEALESVRYAALLHDVGKIGIPDGILLKPGKLIPEEFSIIQKHSLIGHDLVSRVPSLLHLSDAILHHHEYWNGAGYPDGLSGENIPLTSRIVGVVDAFDAMTTPRPYRDPVEHHVALEEMRRCSGTQFDPQIVELVANILNDEKALRESELPAENDNI